MKKYKLGFIGYGNMAKAIIGGILRSGILDRSQIATSDPLCKDADGIFCTRDNDFVANNCDYLLLSVKPQVFKSIDFTCSAECVISIMAGIDSEYIGKKLNMEGKVIRVMPNTPAQIGKGAAAIAVNGLEEKHNAFCKAIFDSVGQAYFIPEDKFDAVTCVSGSGPAYAYYFAKAMIEGGVVNGLDKETSKKLTIDTIIGACEMIKANPDVPLGLLISNVCSKGGTTIEAVNVFENCQMDKIVIDAMTACRKRSEELRADK